MRNLQERVLFLNTVARRVIAQELREGYRGYQLIVYGVVLPKPTSRTPRLFVQMLMPSSPLHPNDGMVVKHDLKHEEDFEAASVESYAMNCVYSIRDLIDKAYASPEQVRVLRYAGL